MLANEYANIPVLSHPGSMQTTMTFLLPLACLVVCVARVRTSQTSATVGCPVTYQQVHSGLRDAVGGEHVSRAGDIERVASESAGDVQNDLLAALLDKRDEALRDVCGSRHVGEEGLLEDVEVHVISRVWTTSSLNMRASGANE